MVGNQLKKNPGENRIFNWKVELNHKGKNISKENKITDTLTGKQKYIEDSIEIYRAELQPDGKLEEIEPALSEGEGGGLYTNNCPCYRRGGRRRRTP